MPFENRSGKPQFDHIGPFMADKILSNAMNRRLEFIEFVSGDRLQQIMTDPRLSGSKVIGVSGKVNLVTGNYPPDTISEGEDYITVTRAGNTFPAYAFWKIYTRKGSVAVTISYQIVNSRTGSIIKSETLTKELGQEFKWARFSGEERALPGHPSVIVIGAKKYEENVYELATRPEGVLDPPEVAASKVAEKLADELTTIILYNLPD
jgi:hypothetical protein